MVRLRIPVVAAGVAAMMISPAVSGAVDLPGPPAGGAPIPADQDWPEHEAFDGCADLIVRSVPGTWETRDDMAPTVDAGMMGTFNQEVREVADGHVSVDAQIVPYPATFGAVRGEETAYPESRDAGVQATVETIRDDMARCPDSRFVIAGFSQGADVAGDALAEIASGVKGVDASRVVAGLLYADPKRSPSTDGGGGDVWLDGAERLVSGANVPGEGLLGVRRDFHDLSEKVFTFCLPGDAVCAMPADANPVNGIFDSLGAGEVTPGEAVQVDSDKGRANLAAADDVLRADPAQLASIAPQAASAVVGDLLGGGNAGALLALAGTHGGDKGHIGYGSQKVAPGGLTPIEWGARAAVSEALRSLDADTGADTATVSDAGVDDGEPTGTKDDADDDDSD